jgi:hypothetical protein
MPEEERLASMHIVDERGRVHSAGDALIVLMARNPATRRDARLARLLPWRRRKIARQYRELADRRGELSEKVDDVDPISVPPRWVNLPD